MKVRSSVKKICVKCKIVHRKGVVRVICANPSTSSGRDRTMARIAGVDLPQNKRVEIGLTYIYGIGRPQGELHPGEGRRATRHAGQGSLRGRGERIRKVIKDEGKVEGDLRKEISLNIKRLMDIGCYRGMRHRRNLPVRGQRTHTNARTRKGPRKQTIAGKKKATKK